MEEIIIKKWSKTIGLSFFILILISFYSLPIFGMDATVIRARGKVWVIPPGGTKTALKKGIVVKAESKVITEKRSIVKLVFPDKTGVSLGPKSEIILKTRGSKEAPTGLISIIKGKMRGQVEEDPLKKKKKGKVKFMFTTKTAAIGIRGTDFFILFNETNELTSVLTFDGDVTMVDLPDAPIEQTEQALLGNEAVIIPPGNVSSYSPETRRVSKPTKLSPIQFSTLKRNRDMDEKEGKAKRKKFRSLSPEGLNAKVLSNNLQTLENALKAEAPQMLEEVQREASSSPIVSEDAPRPGGFIDLQTARYVSPPRGSVFDANQGVFIPPANLGDIDPDTGEFRPPENMIFSPEGRFEVYKGRDPASEGLSEEVFQLNETLEEKEEEEAQEEDYLVDDPYFFIDTEVQQEIFEEPETTKTIKFRVIR